MVIRTQASSSNWRSLLKLSCRFEVSLAVLLDTFDKVRVGYRWVSGAVRQGS